MKCAVGKLSHFNVRVFVKNINTDRKIKDTEKQKSRSYHGRGPLRNSHVV
jgi:hypothetical protein